MLRNLGREPGDADLEPALEWEHAVWGWYLRFQACVIYRTELVPAGMGMVPVEKPAALDRAPWWPLIAAERWDHKVVMTLLEDIEQALFQPLQEPKEESDG